MLVYVKVEILIVLLLRLYKEASLVCVYSRFLINGIFLVFRFYFRSWGVGWGGIIGDKVGKVSVFKL